MGAASAIGARVLVHASNRTFVHINQAANTYLTNSDPRIHVGLGESESIDQIEVYWSDGSHETFPGPAVDQYLILRQNSGQ